MARASAILHCLALASRHAPGQEIDLAEIVDVVHQLIEKAVDRLDEVELLNAINGSAAERDALDISPFPLFAGVEPPVALAESPDRPLSGIAAYRLAWLDQHGVLQEDDECAFLTAPAAEQASTQRNAQRRQRGDPPLTLVVGRLALIPRERRMRPEPPIPRAEDHGRDDPDSKHDT